MENLENSGFGKGNNAGIQKAMGEYVLILNPNTVIEGVNGYTVDIGDTQALGARLLEVSKLPPDQWKKMSEAAYSTATGFSWDDATDLLEKGAGAGH